LNNNFLQSLGKLEKLVLQVSFANIKSFFFRAILLSEVSFLKFHISKPINNYNFYFQAEYCEISQ